MAREGMVDRGGGRGDQDVTATTETTRDLCEPLAEEVAVLQEQIAVLEAGLPGAPGMERAALFKEINEYRATLDARRHALYRCRSAGA